MTGGGDDSTSPYQGLYSWTASTTASGGQNVTARNNAGLTSGASAFTVTPDTTAPASQTTALVRRAVLHDRIGRIHDRRRQRCRLRTSTPRAASSSAPRPTLTNGNCTGGFSAFGGSYSSPDTSVVSGNCYRYRFTVADNVGNVSVAVITGDAKVDTSAPTATMDDPGANLRGTVALTSTTSDPESGLATVTYQRSPAGLSTWTATSASWDTTASPTASTTCASSPRTTPGQPTTSTLVASRARRQHGAERDDGRPRKPPLGHRHADLDGQRRRGSGLDTATFQYSLPGHGPWTTIGTDSSAPFSVDWDTTGAGRGATTCA